jgi:hypothetical protein
LAAVTFRGVDHIKIFVATIETDGMDAAGQGKGRDVDLIQLALSADHGIADAKQEIAHAGIG